MNNVPIGVPAIPDDRHFQNIHRLKALKDGGDAANSVRRSVSQDGFQRNREFRALYFKSIVHVPTRVIGQRDSECAEDRLAVERCTGGRYVSVRDREVDLHQYRQSGGQQPISHFFGVIDSNAISK